MRYLFDLATPPFFAKLYKEWMHLASLIDTWYSEASCLHSARKINANAMLLGEANKF